MSIVLAPLMGLGVLANVLGALCIIVPCLAVAGLAMWAIMLTA